MPRLKKFGYVSRKTRANLEKNLAKKVEKRASEPSSSSLSSQSSASLASPSASSLSVTQTPTHPHTQSSSLSQQQQQQQSLNQTTASISNSTASISASPEAPAQLPLVSLDSTPQNGSRPLEETTNQLPTTVPNYQFVNIHELSARLSSVAVCGRCKGKISFGNISRAGLVITHIDMHCNQCGLVGSYQDSETRTFVDGNVM